MFLEDILIKQKEIPEFVENEDIVNEEEIINIPSFFRVLDRKEHELNGTMRRISTVPDLELGNHKSWYQPLKDDMSTPYMLLNRILSVSIDEKRAAVPRQRM